MTPRQFDNALRGKLENHQSLVRAGWEQARWIITYNVMIAGGRKSKVKKPTDIATFPWERQAKRLSEAKRKHDLKMIEKSAWKFEREGKKIPLTGKVLAEIMMKKKH